MAANNYAACLAKVLRYEGGYVNDPHDPGGETNYGITVAVARANGYQGAMRSIPMDLVKAIYRKRYWDVVHGDSLPAGLDLCVFDYAVNSGPGRANPLLTQVNAAGGTTADRINRYCDARLAFLKRLATWSRYGKGWGSRVADVKATALKMAAAPPVAAPAATPAVPAPATKAPTGGEATAGGAVVVGGGAVVVAASEGWGWIEWSIAGLVLLAVCAAAFFGWRWWKARRDRKAAIDAAGNAAVAEALNSQPEGTPTWTGDQLPASSPLSPPSSELSSEQLSVARLALSSAASQATPSRQHSTRKQPRKRSAKPLRKTRKRPTSSRSSKKSAVRKSSPKRKPKSRGRNSKG